MRLICPNCGAEYEPPRNMMPSGGRHVQCSACHTRWFAKGDSQPLLTDEQIIAKLESRGPNLRVVEEPVAAPWSKQRQAEETTGPEVSEPLPSVSASQSGPEVQDTGSEQAVNFDWENPDEPAHEDEPEADRTGFEFEAPPGRSPEVEAERPFVWEAPPPGTRERAREAPASVLRPAPRKPEPAGRQASGRPELVPAGAHVEVTRVDPVSMIAEPRAPRRSRFWLGVGVALCAFVLLVLLYLVARAVPAGAAAIGPAAGAYAHLVDGMREGLSGLLRSDG
jgi:predicted Zn finger-like uncharacterized protein